MSKRIYITESQLDKIVESTKIDEARSIKSKKLQKILSQHGGIARSWYSRGMHTSNSVSTDIHNMPDEDILGVLSPAQLEEIQKGHTVDHWRWADNYGLDIWAKENGVQLERGDRVESQKLGDGMYLIFVERNAEFEYSGREGGYKEYATKKNEREKNNPYKDSQAKRVKDKFYKPDKGFRPVTDKAWAARSLRRNPYFWAYKRGEMRDRQSGWNDPEVRKKVMGYARQGLNQFGRPALKDKL